MAEQICSFLNDIFPKEHVWKMKLFQNWDGIIGSLKSKVRIEKLEGSMLVLGVCHPAWAQELFMLSNVIKNKINRLLKEDKIKDIDFLIITDRKVPNILKKVYFDTDKITIDHISDCGDRKCFVYLNNLKIDLFYAIKKDEAFALLHHIGPKSYLLRIRRLAKSKGYLLNQYGIFHRDSGRRVSGKFDTVCDIQKFINISCRPPQKRR